MLNHFQNRACRREHRSTLTTSHICHTAPGVNIVLPPDAVTVLISDLQTLRRDRNLFLSPITASSEIITTRNWQQSLLQDCTLQRHCWQRYARIREWMKWLFHEWPHSSKTLDTVPLSTEVTKSPQLERCLRRPSKWPVAKDFIKWCLKPLL